MAQPGGEVVEDHLGPVLGDLAEILTQILRNLHITENIKQL